MTERANIPTRTNLLEGSTLLTTAEMAAALRPPISPQMLLKHEREGDCRSEPTRGSKRAKMWDPDKVRKALGVNTKRASKHGGKRVKEGKVLGGRKRKREIDQPLAKPFADAVTVETVITRAGPPERALSVMDLLWVSAEELEALCKYAAHVGLTVAAVDLLRAVQSAQEVAIRIEEKRRTLISASDVESAFGVALGLVRSKLEELPSTVTGSAATTLRLTPEHQASLRVIIDASVRAVFQMLGSEMEQHLRKLVDPAARKPDEGDGK